MGKAYLELTKNPRRFVPRPGMVYRTRDLEAYARNATRLAEQLVEAGKLRRLRQGLYFAPRTTVFGETPPSEEELLRGFFRGQRYLRTGPSVWNALGLGSTAVEAVPLVYNTSRSGELRLGRRAFRLRRVKFPSGRVPVEYFVVDLLQNADLAGVDRDTVVSRLVPATEEGRFDRQRLLAMGQRYGSRRVRSCLAEALGAST